MARVTRSGLLAKVLGVLAAIAGMLLLPALLLWLRNVGPAARVVYYAYLPVEELTIVGTAAVLGASLSVHALRRHRATRGLPRVRLIGLGLLLAWIALAQLRAFPAAASVAERDAWARANVRYYVPLTRVIAAVPEVQRDVGRVVAIAPSATEQHRFAREMNGDDMLFALEVVGEHGRGTFRADCTLDEYTIYDWRRARWLVDGREVHIDRVPDRVP